MSKERVSIRAPASICLYDEANYKNTVLFFDQFERQVFHEFNYVHLDFSEIVSVTAAAALMLFAKITRCQCWAPNSIFSNPDQVITIALPNDRAMRSTFVDSGLWAAIKPGGQRKLDKLWSDWGNPYKTGSNPATEITDVISQLQRQFNVMPHRIVAALQEAYLNIAHHAYEEFKETDLPLHSFMVGRWWQYARINPITKKIYVVIYDMGSGIPRTMASRIKLRYSDSDEIDHAMQSGVTRLKIQGRGKGFDNIKKPIDVNDSAEYLVIFSGKGQVTYRRGQVIQKADHFLGVGGTLIEWVFGAEEK